VDRGAGRAIVEVEDRGPGLDPGDDERIFEPFFSTKGSTGLGLFLCHAIATDHGGSLRAANREGGGARFVLELPLANSGGSE
jgi:signal transduction histidine kinase